MISLSLLTERLQAFTRISREKQVKVLLQTNSVMTTITKLNQMSRKFSDRLQLADSKAVLMPMLQSRNLQRNQLAPNQSSLRDVQWMKIKHLVRAVS